MKGSCEIKINSISKPKNVFHKGSNSVRKLHISSGDLTRADYKKKKKNGGEPKMFQQSPQQEHYSLVPLPSLPFFSTPPQLLWPQWVLGPPRIHEELWWERV